MPEPAPLVDRCVVASVSGGKDSGALSLWLTEQGIEHRRVFADTGWEHPATYEYLRGPLADAIGPIDEVRGPLGMADLCRKKGLFPSRVRRFCTTELKVKPIANYIAALQDEGHEVVNAIGIRAAESRARSKLGEREWSDTFDCETWRPLIAWTEQQVIDMHTRHGLAPNPLYLRGHSRVGCWPCIFARKVELRLMAETDPARVREIARLEEAVRLIAEQRYSAKGETFASLGYGHPTFFQAMGALRSEGRDGRTIDIARVVKWATTGRGGRQYELFAPETEPGCVRWGLCEHLELGNDPHQAGGTR